MTYAKVLESTLPNDKLAEFIVSKDTVSSLVAVPINQAHFLAKMVSRVCSTEMHIPECLPVSADTLTSVQLARVIPLLFLWQSQYLARKKGMPFTSPPKET